MIIKRWRRLLKLFSRKEYSDQAISNNENKYELGKIDLLDKTNISHYAADPKWRENFSFLANLSEEDRAEMLQALDTEPGPLFGFPVAVTFLRHNLEDPNLPRVMVEMIDLENLRIEKFLEKCGAINDV